MRRGRQHLAAITAFVLVSGRSSFAAAGELSELESTLQESVVTSASKSAETTSSAPATTTTVSSDELRKHGIRTLAEALSFLAIGVSSSDTLRQPEIGVRGVLLSRDEGNHVLLMIDGHAVNDPLLGAARFDQGLGLPLEAIDHIEVVLGPGSVLYGSNAMLGVVNVVTKKGSVWPGAHVVVEGELTQRALAEARFGKAGRVVAAGGAVVPLFGRTLDLSFGYEQTAHEGYPFLLGPQITGESIVTREPVRYSRDGAPTGVWGGRAERSYFGRSQGAFVRASIGAFEATVVLRRYERAIPYLTANYRTDFDDPDSAQIDRALHVDLRHSALLSSIVRLDTRLYLDGMDHREQRVLSDQSYCLAPSVTSCRFEARGVARWAGVESRASLDWRKDRSLVTLVGADLRGIQVGHKLDQYDLATDRPLVSSTGVISAHASTLGAYVQQTWDPSEHLAINGGTRLDFDPRFSPVLSPRLAAVTRPWTNGALKAVYATAFRAPTWYQTSYESRDQVLARSLSPERVASIEGSIEQKVGAHKIQVGVFRTWWRDLVELHTYSSAEMAEAQARGEVSIFGGTATQFRNTNAIDHQGVTGAVHLALASNVQFDGSVTSSWARRQLSTGPEPLTVAPSIFGNARLAWTIGGNLPTIAMTTSAMGPRIGDTGYIGVFRSTPVAPAQIVTRLTVTGDVPKVSGLSYRVSATYSTASVGPYVIGPNQRGATVHAPALVSDTPELLPYERYRLLVGLQWDFPARNEP
jgi:outer membrane cobalamin receptor